MKVPTGVVVIDDDPQVRERIAAVAISERQGVVLSAGHSLATVNQAITLAPAVVFVRLEDPYFRALEAIQALSLALPDTHVFAHSRSTGLKVFQQAVRAGARFLFEVPLDEAEVARAVRMATAATTAVPQAGNGAGRIITVAGQKGGVGKTAISVNLASALAGDCGASVLIIDFDMTFGDVALALDVHGEVTAAEAAREANSIDVESFKAGLVKHESGVSVLCAPATYGEWITASPAELERLVTLAALMFDYVIVDTPGAANEAVAVGLSTCDNAVIITSLELTSAKNTGLLLEAMAEEGYPLESVLVMANHTSEDTGLEPADICPAIGATSVWEVPFDEEMRASAQVGRPLVLRRPKAPASMSLRALARRLHEDARHIDRRSGIRGEMRPGAAGLRQRLATALARTRLAQAS